jgi:hypothetical protein
VISQSAAVHEQIRELLAALRALHGKAPAQTQTTNAPPIAPDAPGDVVTRSYVLQLGGEPEALRSQVRELVTESLPDEPWSGRLPDGQGVLLAVFPDRIVVRHRADVQEKVRRLLSDSGIATPTPSAEKQPGMPMFGRGGFGGTAGFVAPGTRGAMGMPAGQPGIGPSGVPGGAQPGPEGGSFGVEGGRGPTPGQPPADDPFSE